MAGKLDEKQREEVLRRGLAGENQASIARDFGISRAYVSLIVRSVTHAEEQRKKTEAKLKKRLTAEEQEEFEKTLEKTMPDDHGFGSAPSRWTMDFGLQLAEKLFGKKPSQAVMKDVMKPYLKKRSDEVWDAKPQPPKPFDIRNVDPELAKDESFVAYCQSPIAKQIAWREYEWALREWEERNAKRQEKEKAEAPKHPPANRTVGKRTGKHSGGRGSRFTPKKKKRRR